MPNIEEHIRQAMQAGKFDDLPGKGKPLRMEENPHEDEAWRLAYHLLREGGFSLPWIETIKEIETDIEKARTALRRAWNGARLHWSKSSQTKLFNRNGNARWMISASRLTNSINASVTITWKPPTRAFSVRC